jgi:hypothetical protein
MEELSMALEALPEPVLIVALTTEQAQALHWLTRHLGWSDAMQSTPPHLGHAVRSERAYEIIHAAAALQDAIEKAELHGDRWMYRDEP